MKNYRIKEAIQYNDQKYIRRYIVKYKPEFKAEFDYLQRINQVSTLTKTYIVTFMTIGEYLDRGDAICREILNGLR